ncbi:tape measure protein [Microbacterium phage Celaena]|uniref:tape measure protein n=1 Tax=Microbacterium phage Celaena TaxID=2591214 RepID=UPI00116296E0|nr:tape measure protein [Microbacterium phage Celaena]QDH92394.1 tape measure protein [Microbacterium phage Celaena]
MATGVEIATAWVRLVPSFEGAQGVIAKELGSDAEKAGKDSGKRFGGAMAGAIAGIVQPIAASALASIKGLVGEMAAQVDSTKKFRSTLEFAGIDDSHIKRLTKATQEYADKTVYGLSDIRNITAQLASNGVADYDRLAVAAGNLNAVAGGNAETFKSVGMVLTQTAGQGKLTAENWNQLSDAIPGASGKIQQALLANGAYVGNFREAMSKGEITAEEFNAALLQLGEDPVAVAAAQSTETFEGMLGNLQATVVSVGASVLERLQPAISSLVEGLGAAVTVGGQFLDWVGENVTWLAPLGIGLGVAAAGYQAIAFASGVAAAGGIGKWMAATKLGTAAQAAFNLVMNANPIMLIVTAIAALVAGLVYFFTQTELGQAIWAEFSRFLGEAWANIAAAATWVWENVLQPIFKGIGEVFNWLWTYIVKPIVDLVVNYFRFWGAVAVWLYENAVKPMFKFIGDIFNWLWTYVIKPVVDWITDKLNLLGLGFRILYEQFVKPAFEAVGNVLMTVWNWIDQNVFAPFKVGIDLIGKAFENVAKAIGTAWDGIKKAAAVPINFVLDTVWNNGLRSFWNDMVGTLGLNDMKLPEAKLIKFASGGVLPGYTPGRDVHQFYSPTGGRLALSGGEAIMRPEFTRLVGGKAGVDRLNAMARQGTLGFKDGGVWDNVMGFAGDVWDNVSKAAGVAWEFLSDPAGAIDKHIVRGLIQPLMAGAGDGIFGKTVGGIITNMVKGASKLFTAPGGVGKGTKGMGWQAMQQLVLAGIPGARITSSFRPGSRTVNGGQSYHALGRAIDIVPASMATFNAVARMFPNASELIYTPAGMRQLLNGKPFAGWSEAVKRQHYNHVHLAMAQGGVVPGLFQGGTITKAGYTVVGERGPELLKLPEGAQVNPDYDDVPDRGGVTFNNYAPLGSTPSQELETFANRSEVFLP